ncbi:MAG: hypothetical protein VB071_10480, partial [Lawsonibacter sp.]|nr:hypothetical protein [Lawsonibacter sp.]
MCSSVLPGVGQGPANWAFGGAAAVADVQTNAMLALPERGEIPPPGIYASSRDRCDGCDSRFGT